MPDRKQAPEIVDAVNFDLKLKPADKFTLDNGVEVYAVDAGAEEVIYSETQMLSAERRNRSRLGKLADMPVYSIPYPQIKKIAALKNHIWGL